MSLMIVIIVIKGTIYMSLTAEQQGKGKGGLCFKMKLQKIWKIKEIVIEKGPNEDQ